MTLALWSDTDRYFERHLLTPDPALAAALEASRAAGLPDHHVAPNQGKLLQLLALSIGARRILEIGTLGGYSTIWLARALPGSGRIVTLERDPGHAAVARANLERAALAHQVELIVGPGLDTLPQLDAARPFDLVFIDADKASNPEYFEWALKLTHPGSLIVVDNVVREGRVLDAKSSDADIRGVRRLFEMLAGEVRVSATALQTVGVKGHDGFVIALVIGDPEPPSTEPD